MTIIHSSDLGWKANQDISAEFAALAKTLAPGDVFVFDAMYNISGSGITIANDVTLAGAYEGAGFNVLDTQTNSSPLLSLSDGNTLVDLTITHTNSSTERTQKTTIRAEGDDITVTNSSFSGNTGMFIDVRGDRLTVEDTHFDGGFYQMRWLGDCKDFIVKNTLFENSLGDGIKTARDGGWGTQNAQIIDSVFLNNHRDGLDTTGGFKNSSIVDSYFVGNGVSGLDLKTPIWEAADLSLNQTARDITITGSEFINNGNDIVLTTNDRAQLLDASNFLDWVVQDIFISDTIFENTTSVGHAMVLAKGATGVHADNVTILGKIAPYKTVVHNYIDHVKTDVNTDLNVDATYGSPRSGSLSVDYASMAGPDWSSVTYPPASGESDNVTQPPSSDNDNDVVVSPPPQPDPVDPVEPVVETENNDNDASFSTSNLLKIYIAATDTDENLISIGKNNQIDLADLDGRKLTVYATAKDDGASIGSVKLDIEGFGTRMENVSPYAIFGDSKGDLKGGINLQTGTYTGTITVYSGRNGSGTVLETTEFEYTVSDGGGSSNPVTPTPDPEPEVVVVPEDEVIPDPGPEYELGTYVWPAPKKLDAYIAFSDTDEVIAKLGGPTFVSTDEIGDRKLTIFANDVDDSIKIGSVRLESNFGTRLENVEPYAMFGDSKGNLLGGKQLDEGTHFVTLTAYSGKNGKGSVLESVTVQFNVGGYDQVKVSGDMQAVSSYSASQDKGTATISTDGSSIELKSNAWKAIEIDQTIAKDTMLKVDFKSDTEGEIHGIGFSNGGDTLQDHFFQLDGYQSLGTQDFNGDYTTGSGFKSYIIPVGDYFTGDFKNLVLVADDDSNGIGNSVFDNLEFV